MGIRCANRAHLLSILPYFWEGGERVGILRGWGGGERVGFAAPTPFESRPIGTELALCQRYCEVASSPGQLQQFPAIRATSVWEAWYSYKVTKRANATLKRADGGNFTSVVFGNLAGQCQLYSYATGYITGTFSINTTSSTADLNRFYLVFNNTAGTVGQIGICDQIIAGVLCFFEAEL